MTHPDSGTEPMVLEHEAQTSSGADEEVPPDPLALDPLSPIAAPDRRWFRPAHRSL
jgi:hypothetical protein